MKVYRYSIRSLAGDYLRAVCGLAVGLGIALSVTDSPVVLTIFSGIAVLFGYFASRTVQRHLTRVAITDQEICDAGIGTRVMAWKDLRRIKLRYFGTKRQQRGGSGFMQLTLKDGTTSLTYDWSLDGFDFIAWRAAKALRENGVSMDPASAGNLLTMGLDADGEMPPPEPVGMDER
jgi:hypothetical protein